METSTAETFSDSPSPYHIHTYFTHRVKENVKPFLCRISWPKDHSFKTLVKIVLSLSSFRDHFIQGPSTEHLLGATHGPFFLRALLCDQNANPRLEL